MSSDTNLISIRRTFNELATASKTLPIGVKQRQKERERESKREGKSEGETEAERRDNWSAGQAGRQTGNVSDCRKSSKATTTLRIVLIFIYFMFEPKR